MGTQEKTKAIGLPRSKCIGVYAGGSIFRINTLTLNAILERLRYYGYYPVVELIQEKGQVPASLESDSVSAAIVFDDSDRFAVLLKDTHIPLILVNTNIRNMPGCITFDEKGSIRLAVEHFVNAGRKKIGYIYGEGEHYSVESRITALLKTCRMMELEEPALLGLDPGLRPGISNHQIIEIMKEFSEKHRTLDAVIIGPDEFTPFWYSVVRNAGGKVPDDMAVIGYNNSGVAMVIEPQVTSLWPNYYNVGHISVDHLHRRVRGKEKSSEPYVIPYEIIRRRSTDTASVQPVKVRKKIHISLW